MFAKLSRGGTVKIPRDKISGALPSAWGPTISECPAKILEDADILGALEVFRLTF